MDKKEIIKTIRDLLDTPEHSNKIDAVWDKGFELLRLLEAEQLILNGVGVRREQLPKEDKLCRMNQNFVCNCIDDSRCPNF